MGVRQSSYRYSWLYIFYSPLLLGTWNADPNHIDYIPTRGMNNDVNGTSDNYITEAYGMDSSMNDSIESFNQIHSNGACHTEQHPSSDSYNEASNNQPTIRVPIAGLSSSHFSSGKSGMSTSLKMRTNRRKQPKPWSSSPKLTSSHFCEHNGEWSFSSRQLHG